MKTLCQTLLHEIPLLKDYVDFSFILLQQSE